MIACDPTTLVATPDGALTAAGALLHMPRAGLDCGCIWTSAAEVPLAALLFAACPCGNDKGIGWVLRAVDNMHHDHKHPDAARELGEQPRFRDALLRTLAMDARQRDSIVMSMRDALAPWRRPTTESTGE